MSSPSPQAKDSLYPSDLPPNHVPYDHADPPPYPTATYNNGQGGVQGQSAVVITVAPSMALGEEPVQVQCPHCKEFVVTDLEHTVGRFACIIIIVMLLL
uniref:LITAF domain-containing protein n=1 Tax=Steinernema glaseri TaxID=37863 RepID=A0A1I7ZPK5_9BILA